jgi:cobalt-zinc-cadmium efflux system membrane fusion protein
MSGSSSGDFRRKLPLFVALLLLIGTPLVGWWFTRQPAPLAPMEPVQPASESQPLAEVGQISELRLASGADAGQAEVPLDSESPEDLAVIHFPQAMWETVSLATHVVDAGSLAQSLELTGKIMMNEDRIAHVFPLVEGRVEEVNIHLGDQVKAGDLLVVVQSREVGQAMLQLYQDRLQRDFAVTKDDWMRSIAENTYQLISLIREGAPMDRIESQLTNKPIGQYREVLMSAYIANYKATKQYERLAPLAKDGVVTGRQLLEAESELNAAKATLQSLVEQVAQDVLQASTISMQSVKELQTRVAVGETNLKILGFGDDQLAEIDPRTQGEAVAHYPVQAPFDGTIVSKDVVLLERVGPEQQILSVADLSTVWVTIDAYEEHLAAIKNLSDSTLTLKSAAWPDTVFQARIFYSGDMVDESTRTLSMRAIADNPDRMLKPGMFVTVHLPGNSADSFTRVPLTALQQHEGKTFVFVQGQGDEFRRRDVVLGRKNDQFAEVKAGVRPGEKVVTAGGFAIKSRMLADLMGE